MSGCAHTPVAKVVPDGPPIKKIAKTPIALKFLDKGCKRDTGSVGRSVPTGNAVRVAAESAARLAAAGKPSACRPDEPAHRELILTPKPA
jgi:hypothetical protein